MDSLRSPHVRQRIIRTEQSPVVDPLEAAYFSLLIAVIRRAEIDARPHKPPYPGYIDVRRQEAQQFLEWVRDVWS